MSLEVRSTYSLYEEAERQVYARLLPDTDPWANGRIGRSPASGDRRRVGRSGFQGATDLPVGLRGSCAQTFKGKEFIRNLLKPAC